MGVYHTNTGHWVVGSAPACGWDACHNAWCMSRWLVGPHFPNSYIYIKVAYKSTIIYYHDQHTLLCDTSRWLGKWNWYIYFDVIASVSIRASMTSHGHMTHQEKIVRGSGDEDLLTLSPIYCDVIARVRMCDTSRVAWEMALMMC